jgi:hypothetical protein
LGARMGVGVRRCWSTAGEVEVVFRTATTSSMEASEWKVVVVETTITGSMHVGRTSAGGGVGAAAARRASIAASGLYGAGGLATVPRRSGRRAGEGAGAAGRKRATILEATRRKNAGRGASGVLVRAEVATAEIMVIGGRRRRTRG